MTTETLPTIEVDGTPLVYLEAGAGEPVVFVHGSLGDYRSWEAQFDVFAEHHRAIAYSRRHHHPNPCPAGDADYAADLHADDLGALLDGLGIGSAHVVGSSYGAYTALFLASVHPARVRSLTISEPPVLPLLEEHPEGRPIRDTFLADVWGPAGDLLQRGRAEDGIRTFVDGLFGDGTFLDLPDDVHHMLRDNADEFTLETSSSRFWTPFDDADAARVTAPTLLFSGGDSLRMFQLVADELEHRLPNAEHVRVPDCSHDLPAEDAAGFNDRVLRFIARHSA